MMRFYVTEHLSENMAETPEGYLLCSNVPITRTGEFLYRGDELLGEDGKPIVESSDGVVRIQREADYVFADNTIKSFEGKPFTLDHPDGFVSPDNWQKLAHGVIQNVRPGEGEFDGYLLADILVTTDKAKELIRAGEREISCGYDAEYEQVEKGIGRQTNIVGNHVALVAKGRAGSRCAIADKDGTVAGICTRIDIKNQITEEEDDMANRKKQSFVDKVKDWLDKRPFKDEDDLEEKLKKELEDEDKKKTEDEDLDDDDKKKETEDDDSIEALKEELAELRESNASLAEKVDGILEILEGLLEEDDSSLETGDDDDDDEDDEDDEDKKKTEDEDDDKEEEEKKEAERKEVEDAWPAILSHADILVPGIKLNKPTKDHMTQLDGIRASVLSKAASDSEYGAEVQKLCTSSSFKTMTHDALGVAFVAASQLVGNIRNAKIQQGSYIQKSTKDHKFGTAQVIADINRRNRERYANK